MAVAKTRAGRNAPVAQVTYLSADERRAAGKALRDEAPRGRREAVDPVLPDADDSEPAFLGHGAVA